MDMFNTPREQIKAKARQKAVKYHLAQNPIVLRVDITSGLWASVSIRDGFKEYTVPVYESDFK